MLGRPVGALFSVSVVCSETPPAGVPAASLEAGPSPTSLVAMTLTAYSTPPVSPVMVWVAPVTVAWETSASVSQLSAASFHCTLYPVTAEPPLEEGACQEASSFLDLAPPRHGQVQWLSGHRSYCLRRHAREGLGVVVIVGEGHLHFDSLAQVGQG